MRTCFRRRFQKTKNFEKFFVNFQQTDCVRCHCMPLRQWCVAKWPQREWARHCQTHAHLKRLIGLVYGTDICLNTIDATAVWQRLWHWLIITIVKRGLLSLGSVSFYVRVCVIRTLYLVDKIYENYNQKWCLLCRRHCYGITDINSSDRE